MFSCLCQKPNMLIQHVIQSKGSDIISLQHPQHCPLTESRWTSYLHTWLAFSFLPKGTLLLLSLLKRLPRPSFGSIHIWKVTYLKNSHCFTRVVFSREKKVLSVNEKWLPFDSCPLKSRLLWYFTQSKLDASRGSENIALLQPRESWNFKLFIVSNEQMSYG